MTPKTRHSRRRPRRQHRTSQQRDAQGIAYREPRSVPPFDWPAARAQSARAYLRRSTRRAGHLHRPVTPTGNIRSCGDAQDLAPAKVAPGTTRRGECLRPGSQGERKSAWLAARRTRRLVFRECRPSGCVPRHALALRPSRRIPRRGRWSVARQDALKPSRNSARSWVASTSPRLAVAIATPLHRLTRPRSRRPSSQQHARIALTEAARRFSSGRPGRCASPPHG